MRRADPRLLRHDRAARGHLVVVIALGVVTTGTVVARAELLVRLLAGAARGTGAAALIALPAVVAVRAAAAYGAEVAALRAAATVKSRLRRSLADCLQRLGPGWLGRQQPGEITTMATRGLDSLDPYFVRYLPQLVLACLVPMAVLATVATADARPLSGSSHFPPGGSAIPSRPAIDPGGSVAPGNVSITKAAFSSSSYIPAPPLRPAQIRWARDGRRMARSTSGCSRVRASPAASL